MLSEEEVRHVLNLAKLEENEEDIKKYQIELKKMLDEIDKIKDLNDFDDNIMIAPWVNNSALRLNEEIKIEESDILKNVPSKKGNFISVDVEVLKDE